MPEAGAALRRHYNRNKKNSTYEFIVCMIKSETSDQLLGLHCSKDGKATHTVLKYAKIRNRYKHLPHLTRDTIPCADPESFVRGGPMRGERVQIPL